MNKLNLKKFKLKNCRFLGTLHSQATHQGRSQEGLAAVQIFSELVQTLLATPLRHIYNPFGSHTYNPQHWKLIHRPGSKKSKNLWGCFGIFFSKNPCKLKQISIEVDVLTTPG